MMYLESKKILHRDLSCRNLLIKEESSEFTIKISDFGLAREVENMYQLQEQTLPIRWCAPEIFTLNQHTIKSDVWAFGVTCYEIITFGKTPYAEFSNADVREKVLGGYRLCKEK